MSTLDWSLQQATKTTAQIAAATTIIPLTGQIVWNTDTGKYCIGDGTTALSALTFYGGISASGLTVGTTTITGGTNTKVLYNNNGVVGEYTVTGTGSAVLNTSPTFVTDITTPLINPSTFLNIGNAAIPGGSLSKVRIGLGTGFTDIGEWASGRGGIWFNLATPTVSNFHVGANATGTDGYLNGSTASRLLVGGSIKLSVFNTQMTFNPSAATGSTTNFDFTTPNNTSRTASTNVSNFIVRGGTITYNAGALTNWYANYFTANTLTFGSTSTATNSYGLFVEAATAGTNATITNNYALGTNGKAKFGGNIELTQTVTTEALVSDTSVTIVINGVTYKLLAKA